MFITSYISQSNSSFIKVGMLVVNVTWRGRNYIGCLTDSNNECQKNRSASEARCVFFVIIQLIVLQFLENYVVNKKFKFCEWDYFDYS